MERALEPAFLRELLRELGSRLHMNVSITVVGASAALLTRQLPQTRATLDCDVIQSEPAGAWEEIAAAAREVAASHGLPDDWLSDRVTQLDVLPSGWKRRRVLIGKFGRLEVWSVGRIDLLAMKVYAGRMQDRNDVLTMNPTASEGHFIRRYLDQLRVPSRQANLDQVLSAIRFLESVVASHG